MVYKANTPDDYVVQLPNERQQVIEILRRIIIENLPEGFHEIIQYGMIGYVVPHSIYPSGYHVDPKERLPFMGIASQKNHIALYHMGIYLFPEVLNWFKVEYPKYVNTKLDMGKSCIRFKNLNNIPYTLIAELCKKISVEDYIEQYKNQVLLKSK